MARRTLFIDSSPDLLQVGVWVGGGGGGEVKQRLTLYAINGSTESITMYVIFNNGLTDS